MPEVVYIIPAQMLPQVAAGRKPATGGGAAERIFSCGEVLHETPYGKVAELGGALVRDAATDPRALIYAAKQAGATAVLAAGVAEAVSPLLEPGDLVVPADVVDLTRLLPNTFYEGKGYGFIKVDPPFCPELMAALYEAVRGTTPRAFRGATFVGTDGNREPTPAELRMYRAWGGDVVGAGLLPEAFLARELELCYAAVAVVCVPSANLPPMAGEGGANLLEILARAAALRQGPRGCRCGQAMAGARAQGLIGADWREWVG